MLNAALPALLAGLSAARAPIHLAMLGVFGGGVVGFLKSVFDGDGEIRIGVPVEIRIGDSMIMVSDGGGIRGARARRLWRSVGGQGGRAGHRERNRRL